MRYIPEMARIQSKVIISPLCDVAMDDKLKVAKYWSQLKVCGRSAIDSGKRPPQKCCANQKVNLSESERGSEETGEHPLSLVARWYITPGNL